MIGDFAVHLGGGAYLDSSGTIRLGAPPDTYVFPAPAGFKIDAKKLEDTFKDLSGILPQDDDEKEKWMKWGAPKELVELLSSVAGTAAIVGTAIATYFWVLKAVTDLMDALDGSDEKLSPSMQRAFKTLLDTAKAEDEIRMTNEIIGLLEPFKTKIGDMNDYVNELRVSGPTGPASLPIYSNMRDKLEELNGPLGLIRDEKWLTLFDIDDYKGRFFINNLLATVDTSGNLQPLTVEPQLIMFNYRLGVPAMLFAYTTFLALARTAVPWFRTNGSYAFLLRGCANSIDTFVVDVQTRCLARTNHSAKTILQEQVFPSLQMPGLAFDPQYNSLKPATYPVGAFDLVNYHDGYLGQRYVEQFLAKGDVGRRGAFDYSFETKLTDLDEIAAAANDQARQDWTELQAISGVFHLIRLAGQLRWATTPPMQSEIVRGSISNWRNFISQSPATVSSPPIFPAGTITSSATKKTYEAHANLAAVTQEPGFFAPKFYRIMLRTVDSQSGKEGWRHFDYVDDVWSPFYRKTDGDTKNFQLDSNIRDDPNAFLWQKEIISGNPDAGTRTEPGTVTLTASTFDWYVPILGAHSPFVDLELEAAHFSSTQATKKSKQVVLRTSGGVSMHAWKEVVEEPQPPMKVMSGDGPLATRTADLFDASGVVHMLSDISLERAERRHVKREQVTLEYQLTWTGSDLTVSLKGNPQQRSFQVFVVIEERSYSGGQPGDTIMLHMPFTAEIVNQLYMVPEDFFRREAEAIKNGEGLYNKLNTKYAKSREIGPGDPVEGMLNHLRDEAANSKSTSTIAEGLQTRLDFMREAMPEEFDRAVAAMRTRT